MGIVNAASKNGRVLPYHSDVARRSFKSRFSERFGCPDSEYEERAFKKCLYLHARCVTPVLLLLRPDYFAEDFDFVPYLGETTGWREANSEVLTFQDSNRARGFLRTTLRIRASGRKASALTGKLSVRDSPQMIEQLLTSGPLCANQNFANKDIGGDRGRLWVSPA
jgi:hypothetical protein